MTTVSLTLGEIYDLARNVMLANGCDDDNAGALADIMTRAHVLGFGLLVVFVIRYMPNGIVGDWPLVVRFFQRRTEGKQEVAG